MSAAVAQRVESAFGRPRRSTIERAIVARPGVVAAVAFAVVRLSPRSRVRQRVLRWAVSTAIAALNRGDIGVWVTGYAPDAVHEWSPGFVSLGLPERAQGREGLFDAMTEWTTAWETWTMTARFIVDLGPAIVNLNRITGRSAGAGVEVEIPHAAVVSIADGLASRERDFNDWSEGLRVAGVDPERLLPRLERLAPGEAVELRLAD